MIEILQIYKCDICGERCDPEEMLHKDYDTPDLRKDICASCLSRLTDDYFERLNAGEINSINDLKIQGSYKTAYKDNEKKEEKDTEAVAEQTESEESGPSVSYDTGESQRLEIPISEAASSGISHEHKEEITSLPVKRRGRPKGYKVIKKGSTEPASSGTSASPSPEAEETQATVRRRGRPKGYKAKKKTDEVIVPASTETIVSVPAEHSIGKASETAQKPETENIPESMRLEKLRNPEETEEQLDIYKKEAQADAGKNVDFGTAQALRDAGWTLHEIADYLHCSVGLIHENTHPAAEKKYHPLEWAKDNDSRLNEKIPTRANFLTEKENKHD